MIEARYGATEEDDAQREAEAAARATTDPLKHVPPSDVTEIYYSYFRLLGISALLLSATGLLVFLGSIVIAAAHNLDWKAILLALFIGFCLVFPCAIMFIYYTTQLFAARRPVVTIGSEGIRDGRLAAELIPWCFIENIERVDLGNGSIRYTLDPIFEKKLTLTRLAKWTCRLSRLGTSREDIEIVSAGVEHDKLFRIIQRYARKHAQLDLD